MNTEKGSDTPRTDAAKSTSMFIDGEGVVEAKICRQLEQELAEWEACARRLAATLRSELRGESAAYSETGNPCAVDDLAEYDRLNLKSSP